jgi:hypothetical protein
MTRAALAAIVAALVAAPAVARAEAEVALPKKDRERAAKAPRRLAPPPPGAKPRALVNLYNAWTHEWLAVVPGEPVPRATVDRFLRDHYTNKPARMEPKLIDVLVGAARHFRSDTAVVVSAFRHPKYNLILRKKGRQVARDSNHTRGNAVDFYVPKIDTRRLHAWAKRQKLGGVGLYPTSQFVHMDTGAIRFWTGE